MTVELHIEACAAYVRFTDQDVAKTKEIEGNSITVTVDFAEDGSVVGIELVGVQEFT